jgi:LacI family transcriptional regulator
MIKNNCLDEGGITMAGIIEVAKRAGVSIATVSRVVNKKGYVSDTTKEAVNIAIKELNFVPNEMARGMLRKRSKTIALIVQNITNPFFAVLTQYIQEELSKRGYLLMLCNSFQDNGQEIAYLDMLRNAQVDGIILASDAPIQDLITEELPIVSFDRHFSLTPCITSENYVGGEMAAKRLIQKGCKVIAFIGDDAHSHKGGFHSEVTRRQAGFSAYASKHPKIGCFIKEYPKTQDESLIDKEIQALLQLPHLDGIFAISDVLATKVIRHIKKSGKRVPEDIKVIGFDGVTSQLNTGPVLTSIVQHIEQIAVSLIETVLKKRSSKQNLSTQLSVSLRDGETC